MKFIINQEERDLYVEYKKKQKVSVLISPEGFLTIRAPKDMADDTIRKIVEDMIPRIEKKLAQVEANKKIFEDGSYNNNEVFKLFGQYQKFADFGLEDNDSLGLRKLYSRELKTFIEDLLKEFSKKMRVSYKSYKLNDVKTNWGSCNSDKNLTFNLRLAMAPKEVIEYVVIHKLAHLKHMNHDKSFWSFVGRFCPDYKERQDYLRKFGQFMTL